MTTLLPIQNLKSKIQNGSEWNIRSRLVELVLAALGPIIEPADIDDDLSFGIQLDVSSIHRARRWPLEVYALAVVAAAVTGTLEFILAGLPMRRTPKVRAARVDDE